MRKTVGEGIQSLEGQCFRDSFVVGQQYCGDDGRVRRENESRLEQRAMSVLSKERGGIKWTERYLTMTSELKKLAKNN